MWLDMQHNLILLSIDDNALDIIFAKDLCEDDKQGCGSVKMYKMT